VVGISVSGPGQILPQVLPVTKDEPLRLELTSFFESVRSRKPPEVSGEEGAKALSVGLSVLDKIKEHSLAVAQSLASYRNSEWR
jgi:hypothetical protein